jgi:hypothetical protein
MMNEEPDKRESKNATMNPRQDRLKLALRENLKRRKSQARGRSEVTIAPSEDDDLAPHDPSDKRSE